MFLFLLSLFVQLVHAAPDPLNELTINVNTGGLSKRPFAENVETLSSYNMGKLLESMETLKGSHDWQTLTEIHGLPAKPECGNAYCAIHDGDGGFLPWHRIYIDHLDFYIRKQGVSLEMPYWDWTTTEFPRIAEHLQIVNPLTKKNMINPFKRGFIYAYHRYTTRNITTKLDTKKNLQKILTALEEDNFILFALQHQFVHNDIHDYVGGDMGILGSSSFDPIFFLHHSMVDLVWAVYQAIQTKESKRPIPQELLQLVLKPWTSTAEKTFYLLRRYNLDLNSDRIIFGGMNLSQIKNKVEEGREKGKVFAGFIIESFYTSGRIYFNICIDNNCSYPGGSVTIIGDENEKYYINSHPVKVDVTEELIQAGIQIEDIQSQNVNFNVTAFETIDGKKTSLEIIKPLVIIKEGFKNGRAKEGFTNGKVIYSISFDKDHLLPPKLEASKDIAFIFESPHGKVYKTNDRKKYEQCVTDDSEAHEDGTEMHLPPGIHYFYDKNCCRNPRTNPGTKCRGKKISKIQINIT